MNTTASNNPFVQSACPSCGYCPHCGRGGYARPYYQPWFGYPKYVTSGGNVAQFQNYAQYLQNQQNASQS